MNQSETLLSLEDLVKSSSNPIVIRNMWVGDIGLSYNPGTWVVRWNGGEGKHKSLSVALGIASENSFSS